MIKLKPWKATRSGTIPNTVFIHARELLVPFLGPIFRATDTLKMYPEDWKLTETPILKKPGKPDYTSTSVWRLIVLSNRYARLLVRGHPQLYIPLYIPYLLFIFHLHFTLLTYLFVTVWLPP